MKEKFVKNFFSKSAIKRIEKKCDLMGIEKEINPYNILVIRLLGTILIFILFLFFSNNGYILAPLSAILFYYGVEYIYLDGLIKKRRLRLDSDALFFFQVLTLALESGKDLKGALLLTCDNIDSTLSEEFRKTIKEVDYGKGLKESLNDMKKRIPSEAINSVIVNITQSNIYGNNIIDSLNNQVEYLRNKKLLEARALINKMPMKISILSVLFMIPIVMLILLGPLLIKLIDYLN